MTTPDDQHWLRVALELAEQCPPSQTAFAVGAVIVDADDVEIARGYSRDTHPTVHAEESALEKAAGDRRLAGATIYSTMEPCGERHSRPQTCAQLIIESGIKRVVFGQTEPTDFVEAPSGLRQLAEAGLKVDQLAVFED